MSYPKYLITYIAMNSDADSNPFGHACILLSRQESVRTKIEALDCIGYYGITPSSDTNPITKKVKRWLGMDIDFTGGYGILRREEMRYIDRGVGLEGKTFLISKDQFDNFISSCQTAIKKQEEAIELAYQTLKDDGIKPFKVKGKEQFFSRDIYQKELAYAASTGQTPRLTPFELRIEFNDYYMPTFRHASTCKTKAVELLVKAGVEEEHILQLGKGHSKGAVPRFSGQKGPIPLHGIGPLKTHFSKRTQLTYFNHVWQRDFDYHKPCDETLWWTLPPQHIMSTESTSEEETAHLRSQYDLPRSQSNEITTLMAATQRIERLLIHSKDSNRDMNGKLELLYTLRHFTREAFSHPYLNQDRSYLIENKHNVQDLLQSIYDAIQSEEKLIEFKSMLSHKSINMLIQFSEKDEKAILKCLHFCSHPLDTHPLANMS